MRLAAALLVLWPAAGAAQSVTRGPYLQMGTHNSVVVVWRTDIGTNGIVRYGASSGALTQNVTVAGNVTQHVVQVTGLTPGTRYYYSVGHAGGTLAGGDAEHYFETAPLPGSRTAFRMWLVGDSGIGGGAQVTVRDTAMAEARTELPDIYLHVGDMAYSDGLESEFQTKFFNIYQSILRRTVTWPAMGNHEGHTSDSGTQSGPYYDAYVLPTAAQAGGVPSGTEAYYSFDYANVHFVVLDSHDSPRDTAGAMLTWLSQDLAATSQEWLIAYWHHPPYTKGTHDSDTEGRLIDMRENALPILEGAGVDLVLTGHSHIYERSFLLQGAYATPTTAAGHIVDAGDGRAAGDGAYVKVVDGAVYVVAGHGGTSVGGDGNHPVMYFSEVANGSCLIDVDGGTLTLRNIRLDGVQTDDFVLMKGNGLALTFPNGGAQVEAGGTANITWSAVGVGPNVRLELSLDGGVSWTVIVASTENDGTYAWTVPSAPSSQALIRITDLSDATLTDTSSGPFAIVVGLPEIVVPMGSIWRYSDGGTDLGDSWRARTFDDVAWASGGGQLGYGDGDEATVLSDVDPNIPSVYFRHTFAVTGPVESASMRILHDDGAAVWVNDTLVWSEYMGNGTGYASYASAGSNDNEIDDVTLPTTPFVDGTNLLAVMVKQASTTSSDLSFDLELTLRQAGGGGGSDSGPPPGGDEDQPPTGADAETFVPGGPKSVGGLESGCTCDGGGASLLVVLALLARRRRYSWKIK